MMTPPKESFADLSGSSH